MKAKKIGFVFLLVFGILASVALFGGPDIKLRFLEGRREGTASAPAAVTSSYEKIGWTAPADYSLEAEIAKIKKVYNLTDVKLITESNLKWPLKGGRITYFVRFEGKEFMFLVTPKGADKASQFRVEVYEQKDKDKVSLLDSEFKLPADETVVLGFEGGEKTAYFLYLTWPGEGLAGGVEGGVAGGVKGGVEGGVAGGVKGGVEGGVSGGTTGAVKASKDVKPPKLLKMVDPVYPEEAKNAGVEGVVIIEARTDAQGKVIAATVLRSVPQLDQAAVDAVRQWAYEPMLIKGKPTGVIFTVTIKFTLKDKHKPAKDSAQDTAKVVSVSETDEEFAKGAVKVEGEIKPPRLVKTVNPVYPEEARSAEVQGVVILAARIDTNGKVKGIKVLRSIPQLDQAAIDALKQWIYEPLLKDGKPVEAVFTVTVRFQLK